MKKLTQAIFNDAPDWVKSVAVTENGYAYGFELSAAEVMERGLHLSPSNQVVYIFSGKYDTTNWQLSAIDREQEK